MSQYESSIGDNIEFTAVAIGDYEIFMQHNDNTSANDTEFKKYPDNQNGIGGSGATASKFIVRADASIDLVELNGVALTDPITIVADKSHAELRNTPIIFKMKLRTGATNTAIKVRWF